MEIWNVRYWRLQFHYRISEEAHFSFIFLNQYITGKTCFLFHLSHPTSVFSNFFLPFLGDHREPEVGGHPTKSHLPQRPLHVQRLQERLQVAVREGQAALRLLTLHIYPSREGGFVISSLAFPWAYSPICHLKRSETWNTIYDLE
jgi:hypothetical protein